MFYDEHFIIFRILIIFRIISNDSSSSQCLTLQSSERKNIISYTFYLTKLSLCISVKYVKQHNIFHKFKKKKKIHLIKQVELDFTWTLKLWVPVVLLHVLFSRHRIKQFTLKLQFLHSSESNHGNKILTWNAIHLA